MPAFFSYFAFTLYNFVAIFLALYLSLSHYGLAVIFINNYTNVGSSMRNEPSVLTHSLYVSSHALISVLVPEKKRYNTHTRDGMTLIRLDNGQQQYCQTTTCADNLIFFILCFKLLTPREKYHSEKE